MTTRVASWIGVFGALLIAACSKDDDAAPPSDDDPHHTTTDGVLPGSTSQPKPKPPVDLKVVSGPTATLFGSKVASFAKVDDGGAVASVGVTVSVDAFEAAPQGGPAQDEI